MKIDEAKEREAFEAWFRDRYRTAEFNWAGDWVPDMFIGWKARAAQPVTVSREAFRKALSDAGIRPNATTEAEIADAFAALGIEVMDK